jgi:hypothetical protein
MPGASHRPIPRRMSRWRKVEVSGVLAYGATPRCQCLVLFIVQ